MSIAGIASSALFSVLNTLQNSHNNKAQNATAQNSQFQQIQADFQQLGQDLQGGNLAAAQQDFTTLQQALPDPIAFSQATNSNNPIVQAFNALARDLQGGGNLTAAQRDFATLQQDIQQNAGTSQIHHHHHHRGGGQNTQEQTQINQDFTSLANALQSGDLNGAKTAFASLQRDLPQLTPSGLQSYASNSGSSSATRNTGSNLSVSA